MLFFFAYEPTILLFVCSFVLRCFARAAAAEHTYNILFIQSYTSQTPWHNDLNEGGGKGVQGEWTDSKYYY